MKDTFYFSHDYNARNDPKLQKLLMKLGQEGKGIYWDLIEMLYEENGYLKHSDCESYAFALRTECETLKSVINDFDLFEGDEKVFWSPSVLKRLKKRKEKSAKAKKSAKARWSKKAEECERIPDALQTQSESNAIKERKGKESKGNNIEYSTEILELKEFCKKYFEEKYINAKSLECFDALIRIDVYTPDQIKKAIELARSDSFWDKNFLTPVKLRDKDKNGVKFIDRFLKIKTNASHIQVDKKGQVPQRHEI